MSFYLSKSTSTSTSTIYLHLQYISDNHNAIHIPLTKHHQVPVLLYSWERYQQTKKGGKPFQIIKVEYIAPVMGLYFKPVVERDFSFKEGQYLYVR